MPKVQLIRPPLDDWYSREQLTDLVSIPIGLCILSKKLGDAGISVSILDGLHLTLEETLKRVEGDVIGVTESYSFHQNALLILKEAKSRGAKTVMGGPNVNHLAERILANHDFVDYAVIGDGEEALPMLAAGVTPEEIPNLVYRKTGQIRNTTRQHAPLMTTFDLEDIANLQRPDPDKPFPLASIRGCAKAEEKGRCSFCSIDQKLRLMEPGLVWKQVGVLREKYGLHYFFETGDTLVVGDYPQLLLKARPSHLTDTSFRAYVCSDQITEEVAETLQLLNVKEVFVGIESTADAVLEKAGKTYRMKDIKRALGILKERKFDLQIPLVYGLTGETPQSAEQSFRFAESVIREYPRVRRITTGPAVPLPGTKLFEQLRKNERARNEYPGDLDRDDFFDYQALVRLQLKYFTSVSFEEIMEKVRLTKRLMIGEGKTSAFHINE